MTMQQNPRTAFLIIGIIMFFVFGSHMLTLALQPDDIWWTPRQLMLSVDEAADQVRVFINDEMLADVLDEGRLKLETEEGVVTLSENDIGFRLNNYHKVVASQQWRAGMASAGITLGLVFLVYGLIPFFMRPEKGELEDR